MYPPFRHYQYCTRSSEHPGRTPADRSVRQQPGNRSDPPVPHLLDHHRMLLPDPRAALHLPIHPAGTGEISRPDDSRSYGTDHAGIQRIDPGTAFRIHRCKSLQSACVGRGMHPSWYCLLFNDAEITCQVARLRQGEYIITGFARPVIILFKLTQHSRALNFVFLTYLRFTTLFFFI